MIRIHYFLILFLIGTFQSFSQPSQKFRDSINRLSSEDHKLMMEKLNISELRSGPSGNPEAPNAANSDETKASPYDSLPDPLVFKDGSKVKTPRDWERRRAEIKEDFDREVYGRVPAELPEVHWIVTKQKRYSYWGASCNAERIIGTG
ncbi:hypothetical protein LZ575_17985 [Antarcticibacterium sp. 1MA-6-2]|uniref:hypothetical protein n=1 Tax=Antarcticibacterium sp. 1MA-6-2 TaxID=2908210 RepID=UPI001F3028CB|nr:hypothetical protein [Antarcticibacterium sp. 1MA-6-2]UJH90647.1 hypothetical protein LZ575_17985 [Antarcticibacterium sp. 1MA-6-2]